MAKETPIVSLWNESKEKRDAKQLALAASMLEANGERAIVGLKSEVLKTEQAYESAMRSSAKDANFQSIVDARVSMLTAKRVLTEAVAVFTDLFGEAPKNA